MTRTTLRLTPKLRLSLALTGECGARGELALEDLRAQFAEDGLRNRGLAAGGGHAASLTGSAYLEVYFWAGYWYELASRVGHG